MTEAALSVENLTVFAGGRPAIQDVSLTLESGVFGALVGPNGGGKTTFLRAVLGLMPCEEGRVRVFGEALSRKHLRQDIGYLPQRQSPNRALPISVADMLLLGSRPRMRYLLPLSRAEKDRAHQDLAVFQMEDHLQRPFHDLSLGQQQRVLLAKLLASDARLLLLDEPETGLDQNAYNTLYDILARTCKEEGRTIFMITHDIGAVSERLDWVACINTKLIHTGTPADTDFHEMVHNAYGEATPLHHSHCETDHG